MVRDPGVQRHMHHPTTERLLAAQDARRNAASTQRSTKPTVRSFDGRMGRLLIGRSWATLILRLPRTLRLQWYVSKTKIAVSIVR